MRIVPAMLAMLAASGMPLAGATIAEKMEPHDVELADLVERPHAFLSMRVRFRATFVQTAGIFSRFHTQFHSGQYLNFVVWDDDAPIWVPEARAEPVDTLYFSKKRDGSPEISVLEKYTIVEVIGEVVSDFREQPWISCHSVEALPGEGTFTDNAIYHIEQAIQLDAESKHVLADEHFASALEDPLPIRSRIDVLRLQGENLIDGKNHDKAIEVLSRAIAIMEEDESLPRTSKAQLHYLRAKALSEQGERLLLDEQDPGGVFERAVADATLSLKLDPTDGDTYAVLGISLAGLERFDEAKRQCQRAIRLRPENAEVRWYLGRILDLQEDFDEAINVLREAIDLAPKDYRLHKAIGRSYFNGAIWAARALPTIW